MAFGVKMITVKLQNDYSLESLYEAIQDKTFAAGRPSMVKHGLANIIAFPALDSQNQVQILPAGMKKEGNAFRVMKAEEAGLVNMAGNEFLKNLTGGLFSLKSVAGKNAKEIERLVTETAKELESMGL